MSKKIERGQATRKRLVATAAKLFAEKGYEATSIEDLLRETEMSRGALYHHFDSKEAVFEAVLHEIEAEVAQATVAASRGARDPASRTGRLALPLRASPRPDRPRVKRSKHDRCAGRLEPASRKRSSRSAALGALDARIDLRATPSRARRFARRGPDVAFPVVTLCAEPKQGKHRWRDRDLGVVLAPKRPRRRP